MYCCHHIMTLSFSSSHLFCSYLFFFFTATSTTHIYTLSLHDALPIYLFLEAFNRSFNSLQPSLLPILRRFDGVFLRSEEHTSELQSRLHLVCRLLLEKKKDTLYTFLLHHRTRSFVLHTSVVPCFLLSC